MPELPEVEVVRRGLARWVARRTVADAKVLHPRADPPSPRAAPTTSRAGCKGRRVGAPRRRGKYLWLPLEDRPGDLAHLGMSGQLLVAAATTRPTRSTSGSG